MDVVKRLAIAPAGAHQLDDPAGAHPALTNGLNGVAGSESPAHPAAMAGLDIAYHYRKVPVAAELGDDLLIQPALVVFDRQEQVGALLGGELKNAGEVCSATPSEKAGPTAWISTPSSSSVLSKAFCAARSWDSPVSNEVCAIATPSSRAQSVTWVTNRVAPSASRCKIQRCGAGTIWDNAIPARKSNSKNVLFFVR